ncbi:methyltransferase domain-containing protein [Treponema phagedenis]|nr:class I SAM-dependent methyltransferase [Treponema phagedenis]TYT79318.1 methyltransferase domain-containing protein [Treponema phagedenis]
MIFFSNRLIKRYKILRKWAEKNKIFAYRLYDKDIPEIPLAVDVYIQQEPEARFAVLALYERPYVKNPKEEERWLDKMAKTAADILETPVHNIFIKLRKRQSGLAQYEKIKELHTEIIVPEGACKFIINLSDYLDTGLFLDHRPLRLHLSQIAANKKILNLFCYTGAFTVHAASGGAAAIDSVDLSKTYLSRAQKNMQLNGFTDTKRYSFIHADVIQFLQKAAEDRKKWDIIICDPPTFSNSKRSSDFFDINRDWQNLCLSCLQVLHKNGVLYFSSNSRRLAFSAQSLSNASPYPLKITDKSAASIPEDFRNKRIHSLWKIEKTNYPPAPLNLGEA